jgi:hypothetical protein
MENWRKSEMLKRNRFSIVASLLLCVLPAVAADSVLAVDRGLPQSNLNNASGSARSNVRWGGDNQGFIGDDFTIGAPGERWVIDSIRAWAVPGYAEVSAARLSDFYQDVRLYLGASSSDVTPVATAQLADGTDEVSNPNIRISEATGNGALLYDDFGTQLRIWQIDFTNLNVPVRGGSKTRFGVWGMGRPVPGQDGKTHMWFNHGSNAALSGTRQDGADGVMLIFDGAGRADGTLRAEVKDWDKPSDINVQVFAHRAGAPARSAQ